MMMNNLNGYFLVVYTDHADSDSPIHIYIRSTDQESALNESRDILEILVGWNDAFLGLYKNDQLISHSNI